MSIDAHWARIECWFKCRMCGFRVPLNRLDMDGAVVCAKCNLEQAFEVGQWRGFLDEAHAVADASLPPGKIEAYSDNELRANARPGQPQCEQCQREMVAGLDVDLLKTGILSVECACGEKATYEVPQAARDMSQLRAIIATEHRVDRKEVTVHATESAIAVSCPGCSAPLKVDESTKFVTCGFCHVQSRIPDRTWFRLSKKEHVPEPMWLLFRGPSKKHGELIESELDAARRKKHDLDQQAHEAHYREEQEKERRAEAAKREREKVEREAERALAEQQKLAEKASEKRFSIGVGAFLLLLMGGSAAYGIAKDANKPPPPRIVECTPTTPADCMSIAASQNANNQGSALDDYRTACDAKHQPGCDAAERLCATTKLSGSDRVTYYEHECDLGKMADCNSAGMLYASPRVDGLGQDPNAAAKLYKKSCDAGNSAGCSLLQGLCKQGAQEGCPPDSKLDAGVHAAHHTR